MKANRIATRLAPVLGVLIVLSGCATAPRTAPAPAPRPVVTPAPQPAPFAVAPPADWRDAEFSPGNWSHRPDPAGSLASYGPSGGAAVLALRCDRAAGRVLLTRAGSASGQVPVSVITTNGARVFTATAQDGAIPGLVISLGPRDPMLDGIAFSRGRWAVEVPGLPTLTLPAWPEVARVIEDCR